MAMATATYCGDRCCCLRMPNLGLLMYETFLVQHLSELKQTKRGKDKRIAQLTPTNSVGEN